ncbi:lamin tail domain-containing protein [Engelhardtia mirabilis]|uniref:LTD domain-containing protein n=1 Tax=Engelhardtia mirabilis TaxID=2528011 RepID=A0A518BEW5_9BACT|nr:hypothetical protein Pla133_05950 [Planctomycetes bacterium Pla133]QDU99856.1 hypothetical protein Pla86_05950 [Planctomycetes bacterium Pla86]
MNTKTLPVLCGVAAALALAGTANAQSFGNACAGNTGNTPTVGITGLVVQGNNFTVDLTGAPSTTGLMYVGGSNVLGLGLPLPLDLGLFSPGLTGCELNVSTDISIGYALDVTGAASFTFDATGIPAGIPLYLQNWNWDFDLVTFANLGGWSAGFEFEVVPPSGVAAGDLVISEYIKDPSFSADAGGEWIELYNTTASDIDIRNFVLSDNDFDSTVLISATPIIVPAGGYAVLGNDADPANNGGITLDFQYASDNGQYFLANGADEIVLTTYDGIEVDRIEYDSGALWSDAAGLSFALNDGALDATLNDDPANWAESACYIGGAPFNTDLATPGTNNASCAIPTLPAGTGELVISEFSQNPAAVADSAGEYFEVHNPGGVDVDMNGWTICTVDVCETLAVSTVVPAGGYLVFAVNGDPLLNGGLPSSTVAMTAGQFLTNSTGSIQVVDAANQVVGIIVYDDGATYPDGNGASASLDPTKLTAADSQVGANWCLSTSPYGDGDLGTPAAANDSCGL